jgi:hypothetical protein
MKRTYKIEGKSVVLDSFLQKKLNLPAIAQDVYLFNGAYLPGIGERIRAAGYDPESEVGADIIAKVKDVCKKERGIAKIVTLGSAYKMGPAKLQRTLELEGAKVTFDEARAIHRGYWELYKGVKTYEYELLRQYEENGGWVLNAIGRPLGIFERYKGDIVNRVVQSTGHDLHVRYTLIVEDVLRENLIPFRWIIADFHDQSIVEVPVQYAEKTKALMGGECYVRLNAFAKGYLGLKGDAQIVEDLSYAKCSKDDIKQYLKDLGIIEDDEEET